MVHENDFAVHIDMHALNNNDDHVDGMIVV